MDAEQPTFSDTLEDVNKPKSSAVLLQAIRDAYGAFQPWMNECERIDKVFSRARSVGGVSTYQDPDFDLFWSSTEILKPAVYARPPVPVVSTRFSIRDPFLDQVSEILERSIATSLDQTGMDDVMQGARDDLIMTGRGVAWVSLEDGEDKQVVVEHLENTDFLHEPARKWSEVGWVARCAWMTKEEMRKRFSDKSDLAYQQAAFTSQRDEAKHGMTDHSEKAPVWEVWSRVDDRVYWVAEGVDVLLDEADPFLDISGFFPCPKPAYATLKRRTLVPVPDYGRYETNLEQINDLTSRIYGLLDQVRVRGLIPSGTDVGSATQALIAESDDDMMLIPVPAAALVGGGDMVQWLPLDMFANTVQSLIAARQQLISDFYELSGISDIMRGASDAQETLGAQQLKSQYGSIRVREKSAALIRLARDIAAIAGEIISENYSGSDLMALSLTKLPSDADVKKQMDAVKKQGKEALDQIGHQARELEAQQRVMQSLPPQQPPAPQPQGVPAP
ncbi:hypothetical protein [Gluconobacter kondonii]|uniref:hypothetical protein n=1 Tax=Gluconobacter kondonii TaxID=941463 RepID=UPI001B8D45C6|nr:hypothetical protein [Gluconobacter kondonii]MBS1082343.1 hypothetical protein [Gluconobacter kondonii]